ncbi:MAG: hypothetical protein WBK96_14570 [Candidatus Manganitrophaceae bacterium]
MNRKGIDLAALFYLTTAVVCFVPYFQYGHPLLIGAGMVYGLPFTVVAGGLALRKEWGRKLALLLSPFFILAVLPLLFKRRLTFVFSLPFSVGVTYPPESALFFKGMFGLLIAGHFAVILYLFRGGVRTQFPGQAGGVRGSQGDTGGADGAGSGEWPDRPRGG